MVHWHIDKRRKPFAKPHSDLSVHVDSKRLKTLLKATHCVVFKGVGVFAQVHTANLREPEATNWDET